MLRDRLAALMKLVPDLSVRELEQLAELRRGTVQKFVSSDTQDPRGSTLAACARVFDTTTDYLLMGKGKPPSATRVQAAVKAARAKRAEKAA